MKPQSLIENISEEQVKQFFLQACDDFRVEEQNESHLLNENYQEHFGNINSIGFIDLGFADRVIVCAAKLPIPLTETTSKMKQYEVARQLIRQKGAVAGIFVFYDEEGRFRFSFVRRYSTGTRSQFTTFKRYSFYVAPNLPNKTFIQQISNARFTSLDNIQKTFSLEAVTDAFYKDFQPKFKELSESVIGHSNQKEKEDFALLFAIRIIFLGFVQKKGWLDRKDFLQSYWNEYKNGGHKENSFYTEWLEPLFFEALNSPPGRKVKYRNNPFSNETESILHMAPFLNGELFKPHNGVDKRGFVSIPDAHIDEFIQFLFQYNFTIEENTNIDEELELSPEFLGIIFERLVNKADGAVYTPRTEVDFMCRLTLVKWLEKNTDCPKSELFHLFFREGGHGEEHEEDQKDGSFSSKEIKQLHEKLSCITVCDPAAGSGAFPVGMMQVLVDIFEKLEKQPKWPDDLPTASHFDRKKSIIAGSLYGAEVKHWAVWINQLRLWLSLFIDMPEDHKLSIEPLLPSLNFKIRCGDSLVQRIGGKIFPIRGHASLPPSLKGEITTLKRMKAAFFNNDPTVKTSDVLSKEYTVFQKILETQLEEAKVKLRKIGGDKPVQISLLEEEQPAQSALPLDIDTKARLEEEIKELQEELRALKQERPFIWSIEFAEIFYERGGFDIIIGNPPYISSGKIEDPYEKYNAKEYKEALQQVIVTNLQGTAVQMGISGRSNLYSYFYLVTLKLLNNNGKHCFICQNSWMDAEYGYDLQRFIIKHSQDSYLIDNLNKKSFFSAEINTVITLLDAPQKHIIGKNSTHRFIAFKKPFQEVIITENLMEIENTTARAANEIFRVKSLNTDQILSNSASEENLISDDYQGDRWGGRYIRAPEIFEKITEKNQRLLKTLGKEYLEGERYLNTGGADKFFIIENFFLSEDGDLYHVQQNKSETPFSGALEEKFLKPLIKDVTKKSKRVNIKKFDALCVYIPKNEKISDRMKEYILWGETNKFHKKSVTKTQKPWYKPTRQMEAGAPFLMPRSYSDSFITFYNPQKYLSLRFLEYSQKSLKVKILKF